MSYAPDLEHRIRTEALGRRLQVLDLAPGPPHPCPYRPGLEARALTLQPDELPRGFYQSFLDLNFRRLGRFLYRPCCEGCRSCRQLRVPVASFKPNRAQRRCLGRNADLQVELGQPAPSAAKQRLYARYLQGRHDGLMDGSWEEFISFLHTSCVATEEADFYLDQHLVGVGIMDVEPRALSAVYCYFDPDHARCSLGTFNILWMIGEAQRRGVPYLYLGYYVAESAAMRYKATFRPCEVWEEGAWRAL